MKEQFVPYDIALKLKELGFNQDCLAIWDNQSKEIFINDTTEIPIEDLPFVFTLAPLYQQAFEFFRDNYSLYIQIHRDQSNTNQITYIVGSWAGKYITYREAELALLKELIETVKG